MVRKPPNSKAFCMFSSVDTQAGTIGPVNRLPFVYVTLLFFLFIFADSTRESIVCVCVRYTSYTQPNSQKPPHEMRTSKRTRKNVQRKRKKTKAIWCEWINGYSFFLLFQISIPLVCKIRSFVAYVKRNSFRNKWAAPKVRIFGASIGLMINKNLCTHLELMCRRICSQKHN